MSALIEMMRLQDQPTIEVRQPKPGLRHNQREMVVSHRFPVKDGITSTQLLMRNIQQNNALMNHMIKTGRVKYRSAEEVAQDRINRRLARAQRT